MVLRRCRKLLRDEHAARDAMHDVFVQVLSRSDELVDQAPSSLLFRIATNLARDEAASPKTAPLADYPAASNVAEEIRAQNDCARQLQQLTPRQRELLWLAYVEEFSHKEIAETLGIKAPSIRPMLARARQCLSEILRKGALNSK